MKKKKITPYVYPIELLKVRDGDTIEANVWLGFDVFTKRAFRFARLDAKEKGTPLGQEITKEVTRLLTSAKEITIISTKYEKYGRCLAEVFIDGVNLNDHMLKTGLAIPYNGEKNENLKKERQQTEG